jgi:uncharacterized protein YeaO (DUF488 family)
MQLRLKRVYDPPAKADGQRILVDRVWPRGVKKADAALDLWLKEVAPSTALRKWFNHDPEKWPEFQRRYRAELDRNPDQLRPLVDAKGRVTLLYGARDHEHNNAVVLKAYLEKRSQKGGGNAAS